MEYKIRMARITDSDEILKIYEPYITDTDITFEIDVPSAEDFRIRTENIMKQYPYLVCECYGKIVGYAYASKHRERAAYKYSVDLSIYIMPEYHRLGIGRKLYNCLFDILKRQGFYTAYAAIALPNENSIALHKIMGFSEVGVFHNVGYKKGNWHDVIWLEKVLNEYENAPGIIKNINDIGKII
ncbi:MAG: N-acetyltransferase family protein [Oscillospiraceae bacterium]|nr:N-acetyltransferase family protein [Oscillospiraceae bacterium]